MNLQGKKITIIGAQKSALALAKLILRLKGTVRVSEKNSLETLSEGFRDWINAHLIDIEYGGHTKEFIEASDLVILSPGVSIHAPPVGWAQSKGISILGEIEFAYQFCSKPIIAVTGSNGKTTVVTLIAKVLSKAGYRVSLCGNVGIPFSDVVLDLQNEDCVVLEVSSFQMEALLDIKSPFRAENSSSDLIFKGFHPMIGVILNLSQNHLDRHKDMQEYFEAKKKIFLNQTKEDYALLNADNEYLKSLGHLLPSQVIYFKENSFVYPFVKNPNQSAVLEVARILNIDTEVCREVFEEFKGVEHRLEWVRNINGIDFVNDSKSTTAEATRWALNNAKQPLLIICGGRDKNIDFASLIPLICSKVKKMFVIGEAKEKLRAVFASYVDLKECVSLNEAIEEAFQSAASGDCILLSPMCASFDMFRNFEDRGWQFKSIVNNL